MLQKYQLMFKTQIDELSIPANVEINTAGVTEDITEAFTQLGLAMLAAIAIVYLILVVTFGGGLAPFAILFSLPFTVIGALVAFVNRWRNNKRFYNDWCAHAHWDCRDKRNCLN